MRSIRVKIDDTHPRISYLSKIFRAAEAKIFSSFASSSRYSLYFYWNQKSICGGPRVTKPSSYQSTRINVPAPFSTNHQWNRRRSGTECSGPTSGRTTPEPLRLPRARRTIDFFSPRRKICSKIALWSCSSKTTSARIWSRTRRMKLKRPFLVYLMLYLFK